MTHSKFLGGFKAVLIWAGAYFALRITLIPWRLMTRPSTLEVALTIGLLTLYWLAWKFLRPRLVQETTRSIKEVIPVVLVLVAWMFFYLGLWRANGNFASLSLESISSYLQSEFAGGLVLSEVTEEIAYRGILLFLLIRNGISTIIAIVLQAFIFLMPHFIGVAHGHMDSMRSVSTFFLGIIFGWAMISTRRLSVPIALHIFWNFVSGFIFRYLE
jgi:membrane protease YdiL (CAAX protease family)